ncbi:hypothetical protein A2U01_0112152, partial [Trifolium medium]|nr:hypothetical protein [Trifolium medium]
GQDQAEFLQCLFGEKDLRPVGIWLSLGLVLFSDVRSKMGTDQIFLRGCW